MQNPIKTASDQPRQTPNQIVFNSPHFTDQLHKKYPVCISRKEIEQITGGLLSAKYMANLDSKGEGPKGKVRSGRKVGYLTGPFCCWLTNRLKAE